MFRLTLSEKVAGLCKGLVRFVMYEIVVFVIFTLGFSRFAIRFVKVCGFKTFGMCISLCVSEGLRFGM